MEYPLTLPNTEPDLQHGSYFLFWRDCEQLDGERFTPRQEGPKNQN